MADKKTKVEVSVEAVVNEQQVDQELKKIQNKVDSYVKNGYVKLPIEVEKFVYPKQTKSKKSGLSQGIDYTRLQKAQDELISSWNKLSEQGFSSHEDDLIRAMKAYRDYQKAVKSHYGSTLNDTRDSQVMTIRRTIGATLDKYFTRLAPATLESGKKGSYMNIDRDAEFERYAKQAIRRHKAANTVGIDLSQSALKKEDKAKILEEEKRMEKQALIEKSLAQKEYDQKHAKEIEKAQKAQLKQLEKERAERAKSAVELPKSTEPLEDVVLVAKDTKELSKPAEDTRTWDEKQADKKENKKFIKGISRTAYNRSRNTPHNDVNLGVRTQIWDPTALTEGLLQRQERGGTYVDTNSMLRQIAAALPEEIKRSIESLVVRIDKNEAMEKFAKFNDSEKKQFAEWAGKVGMSEALLVNVAKVQSALMAGKEDVKPEDLKNAIIVAVGDAIKNGNSQIAAENYKKAVISIGNLLMARYDNSKDALGGTEGEGERGVGKNYEEVAKTLKDIFKKFEETSDTIFKRAVKEFPEFYSDESSSKSKKQKKSKPTVFDQVFKAKVAEMTELLNSSGKTLADLFTYSIAGNASEEISDAKQIKASRTAIDVAKANEEQGLDSEGAATTLLGQQNTANRLSGEIKDLLFEIFSMIGNAISPKTGKHMGNGDGKPPKNGIIPAPASGSGTGSYQSILLQIGQSLQNIDINVGNILQSIIKETGYIPNNLPAVIEGQGVKTHEPEKDLISDKTDHNRLHEQKRAREYKRDQIRQEVHNSIEKYLDEKHKKEKQEELDKEAIEKASGTITSQVDMSKVITSTPGIFGKLQDQIRRSLSFSSEADRIMNMNKYRQTKLRAQRMEMFGENYGKSLSDTGDLARIKRIRKLWNRRGEESPELFQDVRLTKGFNRDRTIDTTAILSKVQKVLNGPEMFKAQTGGALKNLFGSMFGYIGMDSLEKSRAQAEGLNQVMANVRKEVLDLVQGIQAKEMTLKGMEDMGKAKFNEKGQLLRDQSSSMAEKTFLDLEEQKSALTAALAEVKMIDKVVSKSGGKIKNIVKNIGFIMPELMSNNTILHNINAGLDKNGKALKFQKRTAEILNYSFQLMARHIGQMWKNWLLQLNPLTQIKKLFSDFSSYDPKWQRTMNVIKYNLRDIVKPFMEWIAQKLVNIIGFFDIISMKIQAAFGRKPISLFDQENADKVKKTYEDMYDISASFDELHDVGSSASENNPDNLLGAIYKPQLSKDWEDLAEKIGNLFADVIKGDLGFGDAMKQILGIAWQGVKTLWNEIIWPAMKGGVGEVLAWILGAFVAWKGLKLIGKLLWNAVSGSFTAKAGTSLLKNLFTDANGIVGIGRNLGTLLAGGILAVVGTMALSDAINDSWNQGSKDAVTGEQMNLTDKQTGMDALQGALGGAGAVLGGGMIAAALGASVALGPLVAVAAGVAALAAVVVVGAEAWAYHSKQNKIANNEMLEAEDYAEQAAAANEKLAEVNQMVTEATKIQNTHQEKLNQLEDEYGISLDYVNQKVELAGGNLSILTTKERELYDQGLLTQESIDNYNRLLEIQLELQKQALWAKEQEAIALDIEAGNYELAALRIEQAELQGTITTEEATAKRIQLYKTAGEEERKNLLQNLTPEQRTLMIQYTNATDQELGKLATIWQEASEDTREALLDGVGPETQALFEAEMKNIDKIVEEHKGFWTGVGDTLKEIFTFGQADTWTYNGTERYYKDGYDQNFRIAQSQMETIQNDPTLSEEEKKRKMQNILQNVASYAIGTNYVPSSGLAYLHQGEAVIPKKYNQPYQPGTLSPEEQLYMRQMMSTMQSLDNAIKQGITVNGQFVQRGSDLVAVVNKTNSQTGANLLSNVAYAR